MPGPRAQRSAKSRRTTRKGGFQSEASQVLEELRNQTAKMLQSLGGIRKSGDLERLLDLDRTLAWQLVKIAEPGEALENAANVPSRVSISRFAKGAISLGVSESQSASLLSAYDAFESLVERHAGDRVSFNSMISSAGTGEGWHAAELQHRRNIFRGMSHMTGMQAAALVKTGIARRKPGGKTHEVLRIGGVVGLRLLRHLERLNVFRSRMTASAGEAKKRNAIVRKPAFAEAGMNGIYLSKYSSNLARVEMNEGEHDWIFGDLIEAEVGATAESTLMFGCMYQNIPDPKEGDGRHAYAALVDIPTKLLVADMLVEPGLATDWTPSASVLLNNSLSNHPMGKQAIQKLDSRVDCEYLGTGLPIIKEFPAYTKMIRECCGHWGMDVETYECWRVRMEFPLFGSEILTELIEPHRPH